MAARAATNGSALVLVLAAAFGSSACAPAPAPPPLPTPRGVDRILVRIEFEPALAAPGELQVVHECGERHVVTTGRAGVDVRLPEGPAAFVLLAAGVRHELALRIAPGMQPVVWRW